MGLSILDFVDVTCFMRPEADRVKGVACDDRLPTRGWGLGLRSSIFLRRHNEGLNAFRNILAMAGIRPIARGCRSEAAHFDVKLASSNLA